MPSGMTEKPWRYRELRVVCTAGMNGDGRVCDQTRRPRVTRSFVWLAFVSASVPQNSMSNPGVQEEQLLELLLQLKVCIT